MRFGSLSFGVCIYLRGYCFFVLPWFRVEGTHGAGEGGVGNGVRAVFGHHPTFVYVLDPILAVLHDLGTMACGALGSSWPLPAAPIVPDNNNSTDPSPQTGKSNEDLVTYITQLD